MSDVPSLFNISDKTINCSKKKKKNDIRYNNIVLYVISTVSITTSLKHRKIKYSYKFLFFY